MMKIKRSSLIIIGTLVLIGICWGTFSFMLNFTNINSQSLADKFSPVHFAAPGNNFVGGILRLTTKSLTGDMHITLWSQPSKNCNKQVRGIYFNSQRGKRVRPLDQYTLELLKQTDPLYAQLQIQGWLYTSCAEDDYSIFWQIEYDRSSGTTWTIIAGTNLDFAKNKYGVNTTYTFANSLQYFDNKTPIWYIWDSYGGIGFIGGEMTWSADLITYLNNGWTINDAFQKAGTNIVSSTGSWAYTWTTTGNNATNLIRNLMVQGSVWLSQSMDEQDIIALLGNPQEKTVIMWTENINNATLINQAKLNMEKLCKGKTWAWSQQLTSSTDDVLCFTDTQLYIDLTNEPLYHNKTIIMRSGSVILSGSMEDTSSGLDLFIDQWGLYLRNDPANKQNFDNQWYVTTTNVINSWTLLRGTIIINGLIMGGLPGINTTGYNHKLYIQWKVSSLNTPFAPTTNRIGFVTDVLWAGYNNRINLQNVFVWTCFLSGIGTDGSSCADSSQMASIPLVIVDGKYPSRLLDK